MTRIPTWTWRHGLGTPMTVLQDELTKLYDQYRSKVAGGEATWVPDVDLHETDTELFVLIDLPGVEPSGIELSVTGRTVVLRGSRPSPDPSLGRSRLQERYFGPFLRDIELPEDVDPEGIQADFRSGVLKIRLTKASRARTVTIPVHTS